MHSGAEFRQSFNVGLILRVIDERSEEDAVIGREMFEEIERAHLIPLVGGIRQSVHQIKQVAHGVHSRLFSARTGIHLELRNPGFRPAPE